MLMMIPPPCFFMCLKPARQQKNVPRRFTFITSSKTFVVVSAIRPPTTTPALFTRISSRPRLPAFGSDPACGLLAEHYPSCCNDDLGPFVSEPQCNGLADATAAASHNCDLLFQPVHGFTFFFRKWQVRLPPLDEGWAGPLNCIAEPPT